MARFVADGYLRFDALVPDEINRPAVEELGPLAGAKIAEVGPGPVPEPPLPRPETGMRLSECYPPPSSIGAFLRLPALQGIVTSLVGPDPVYDHDFVHLLPAGSEYQQHLHVDAIVDSPDPSFDIQIFWFPEEVSPGEGGTRFVPGSHLRLVRAEGVARYQHLLGEEQYAGPAGTVLVFHHGLWHAGRPNPGVRNRWMYKIRLNPRVEQCRLWNTDDLDRVHNDFRDHTFARKRRDSVGEVLRTMHPWQRGHEARYELVQRTRLWRHLTGDPVYDVDYYLTRRERPVGLASGGPD